MSAPTFLDLARSIDKGLHGNINFPFRLVNTTPVSISIDDFFLKIDASGGARVLNLPSAVTVKAGQGYWLIRIDSATSNAVTINATGGQTINGLASAAISAQFDQYLIVSDGANWLLYAKPAFANPDLYWIFPNTMSTDQNNALWTFKSHGARSFVGFDLQMNVAPTGQAIIIDWAVNGVVNPAFRVTLNAGSSYVNLAVAVSLNDGDTLQPQVVQVGLAQPGQTAAIRARTS